MNSHPPSFEDLQERLVKLEKQNRRFKQFGLVGLIGVTLLFTLGQAPSKKTIEANEFVLRDANGSVRARLSMNVPADASAGYPSAAQLVFFDEKGKKRASLDGGNTYGFSGLTLNDQEERVRGYFIEASASGANLALQDERGHLQTILGGGEVTALGSVTASGVHVEDVDGFAATLGVTDLVTPRTGEKHKTSAASLILFDNNKNVIWKAP
jgi:hypothetical protein